MIHSDYTNLLQGNPDEQRQSIRNIVELNITLFSKIEALEIETRTIIQKFRPTFDRLADVECELNNLKHENLLLKHKIAAAKDATKMLYLRIEGISEQKNEKLIERVASTLSLTGVKCLATDIDHVYRLGRFKKGQTRSVIVRFLKESTRNAILYSRFNLNKDKTSNFVWINDDVSEETRQYRKTARDIAALAKTNGVDSVKIHSDGIIIDNTKYKHADFDLLPPNLSVAKAKTRDDGEDIYFQGEESAFSNFYPAKFADENGLIFYSAEQAYQHAKAKFHGKNLIANKILCTRNPRDIKRLSKQIPNNKDWVDKEQETMKAIIKRKFQQNPSLADQLIDTQNKQLHEATSDPKWGIGAELASRALANTTWTGQDVLGNLLEQVREELSRGNTHRNIDISISVNLLEADDELIPMHMSDDGLEGETSGIDSEDPTPTAPSPRALNAQNRANTQDRASPHGTDVTQSQPTPAHGAKSKHSTTKKTKSASAALDTEIGDDSNPKSSKSPTPPPRQIRSSTRAQGARDRKKNS